MTRKQEDKYITQLVEEIQKIINKKGLSKIDPISSFRSTALQALESFEYKNRKKGSNFQNIGGFGSISDIPNNIRNPKIVACTDGVGTKIEISNILNKYNIPFALFITANTRNQKDYLSDCDIYDISQIKNSIIGTHGMTHNKFDKMNYKSQHKELEE